MLSITPFTCRTGSSVHLVGELDFFSAFELRLALDKLAAAGDRAVAVDLEHVSFVDASALGVLEKGWRDLRARGVEVEVVNTSARFCWLVRALGLEETFHLPAPRRRLELLEPLTR